MKTDFRKQTFSKPGKPSDDEIKRLTNEEVEPPAKPEVKEANKTKAEAENSLVEAAAAKIEAQTNAPTESLVSEKTNPFLLLRGQTSGISVEKTGYRLRSDYMDLLKLVKRMKKGHTLEAVLDDALTFYFENSEDGRKAVKHRQMLEAE